MLAEDICAPFDAIIVGCKVYEMAKTTKSFAPAVGCDTVILPLLNGTRHLNDPALGFGRKHASSVQFMISVALDPDGAILHLNEAHGLSFDELDGSVADRIKALKAAFCNARFEVNASADIL